MDFLPYFTLITIQKLYNYLHNGLYQGFEGNLQDILEKKGAGLIGVFYCNLLMDGL